MKSLRIFAVAFGLVVCAALEVTWLGMLGLPGAIPPLTLITVLSLALRRSPQNAAFIGFFAGVIVDLMPPSTTALGVSAFTFTGLAYLISAKRDILMGSAVLTLSAIVGLVTASVLIRVGVSIAAGVGQSVIQDLFVSIGSTALYGAMLATFILPFTQWFDRLLTSRQQAAIFR
jgi:rod shape-determining protein MreD